MARTTEPALTPQGVKFTVVSLEFTTHECIISQEALAALSPHRAADVSPMEVFQAYEAKICGVARRMIAANVKGSPLLLEPRSFH